MPQPRRIVVDNGVTDHAITQLYVWVSHDPESGNEGIMGTLTNYGATPMVTSQLGIALALKDRAQAAANETGRSAKLLVFEVQGVVEVLTPQEWEGG